MLPLEPGSLSVTEATAGDESASTLADDVYDALVRAIRSRDLKPGTKLSENEIGQLFGVSRTVVRAALNRLHSESLVEFRVNRGAYVASPSQEEAREIFDLRSVLEVEMVRRLAKGISSADIARLKAHQAAQRHANASGHGVETTRHAVDFHLILARMLEDDVFTGTLENLILRGSLILSLYGRPQTKGCGLHEHDIIIDALNDGDGDKAARLMADHLDQVVHRTELAGEVHDGNAVRNILKRYAKS